MSDLLEKYVFTNKILKYSDPKITQYVHIKLRSVKIFPNLV